jgi:hypothetical protein
VKYPNVRYAVFIRGLTQHQLASSVEMSDSRFSRWVWRALILASAAASVAQRAISRRTPRSAQCVFAPQE